MRFLRVDPIHQWYFVMKTNDEVIACSDRSSSSRSSSSSYSSSHEHRNTSTCKRRGGIHSRWSRRSSIFYLSLVSGLLVTLPNNVYMAKAAMLPDRCERGEYESFGFCYKCPPGKYGSTTTNKTPQCTANCPKGRYRSQPGIPFFLLFVRSILSS